MAAEQTEKGESRWPMAAAVLVAGVLRTFLPPELRLNDARGVFLLLLVVLIVVLIVGDPGRIDRQTRWLRSSTGGLIGLITVVNGGSSVRLVHQHHLQRAVHPDRARAARLRRRSSG